jgi:hypothetical protein
MRRKTNKADMTVTEQLNEVRRQVCYNYCKYMDLVLGTHQSPDLDMDYLQETYCATCPMNEL